MKVEIYYQGKLIKTIENITELIPYPDGKVLIYDKELTECPRTPIAIFNSDYSFVIEKYS